MYDEVGGLVGLLVASPLLHALALWLAALVLAIWRRRGWAWAAAFCAWSWLWLWSTPWASQRMQVLLVSEYAYVPVEEMPVAQAIVVLGGAIGTATTQRPYPVLTDFSNRLWHAARLFRAGKAPLMVLSGGSDPAVALTSEAEAMRLFLLELGIPPGAMLIEGQSGTTRENARYAAELLRAHQVQRVLLVTSGFHMRRATLLFAAEGFEVIAAPTEISAPLVFSWSALLPNPGALLSSTRAIKEWLGRYVV